MEDEDLPTHFDSEVAQEAIESQSKIGFDNFMVGFIASEWVDILNWAKIEHPHKTMEKVLSILWEDLCKPMWNARNDVNRIQGKSMLKNKSPQIAIYYMSSYVGYLHDGRITAQVIVERISSLKSKQRKQLTTP